MEETNHTRYKHLFFTKNKDIIVKTIFCRGGEQLFMSAWIWILLVSILCFLKLRADLKEEAVQKQNFERSMEEHWKYHEKRCEEMRIKELEEKERAQQQSKDSLSHTQYTPSCSFTNDSDYHPISSGFNYYTVSPNDDFLNKMGNPYISNLERQKITEVEIQRMVDSHLPLNSIYRNSDGSVKQHDYSAFGIAANTPGIDLAEAQMFNDLDLF